MRISEATAEQKPLAVKFGAATLNIVYAPLTYTVREMEEAEETKDAGRIIEMMKRLVVSWDLTDDKGKAIPLDFPLEDVLQEDGSGPSGRKKASKQDPLRDVPSHIFTGIVKAVGEDQAPSPEA